MFATKPPIPQARIDMYVICIVTVHAHTHVHCIYFVHVQVDREEAPEEVGTRRTKVLAMQHIQQILSQPTEYSKAQKRTDFGMKEGDNPIFNLSLDPFQ